jgi:hypothetical protein
VDFSLLKGRAWRLYWSWDSRGGLNLGERLRVSRIGSKVE